MTRDIVRFALAAAAAAAAFLPADEAAAGPRRGRTLEVKRVRPRHRARYVPLDVQVEVLFNRPVDLATATSQVLVLRRATGEAVSYRLRTEREGRKLLLVPEAPLEPGRNYEVRVLRGIASTTGAPLRREKQVFFLADPRSSIPPFLRPEDFRVVAESMKEPRASHTATLVSDGTVLLAGGLVDGLNFCISAETFEPATEDFRLVQTLLPHRRAGHVAVAGPANVTLLGGYFADSASLAAVREVDVYDRVRRDFRSVGSLLEGRDFASAVRLLDGTILVTGGLSYDASNNAFYSTTAERLSAGGTSVETSGAPLRRRAGHTLTLLPDGRVLVAGGVPRGTGFAATAEIYDPATDSFRVTAFPPSYDRQLHTATMLPTGLVALADGGTPLLEVFDPATERFATLGGASSVDRTLTTASLLPGGRLLLAGGLEFRGSTTVMLDTMDLLVPTAGTDGAVFGLQVTFPEPRAGHTATSLFDGRVLLAGGLAADPSLTNLDTAILLTPPPPE